MRSNNNDLSFQQRSLFQHYTSDELRQMRWDLRSSPTTCTTMTLFALTSHLPCLPANPLQRRLARLSVGALNFFMGTFFLLGWTSLALAIAACWSYYRSL